ncbi:MAG: hypothetical protein WC959_06940 [Kiritimatiellales bacterium]
MKTLILVRPAAAEKFCPAHDHDRGLSALGRCDARIMAAKLAEIIPDVDAVVCGSAVRAYASAEAYAAQFFKPVEVDERIYSADEKTMLKVVRSLNNIDHTVVLVVHGAVLDSFLTALTGITYESAPKSAVGVVRLPVKKWRNVSFGHAKLETSFSPRQGPARAVRQTKITPYFRFLQWRFAKAQRFEIMMVILISILVIVGIVAIAVIATTRIGGLSGGR